MNPSPVAAALVLCALLLPVTIAGSNLALGVLAFCLLARARTDGRRMLAAWRAEPVLAAVVLYGSAGALAAFFSASPAASFRDAIKDWHRLWALVLFVAALAIEPKAPLRQAFGWLFGAMALYGVAQTVFGHGPNGMMVRAHGFVHPVVFGQQMALAALGGACVLLRPARKDPRAAAAVFTALVCAALVLNQTRMALLAAFVGFGLVAFLEPKARRFAVPAVIIVVIVGAAWEFMPNGGRSISGLFKHYDPKNPHQARWLLWDIARRMFHDHIWTGAGPGGYQRLFLTYYPGMIDNETPWGSAHNLYLHQLAERGIIGGIALLVLCATLLMRAVRAARTEIDASSLWSAGAVAVLLTMSMTETSFQNEQFATLFLLIWAWGTAPLR
jgi:O-antigen ligase